MKTLLLAILTAAALASLGSSALAAPADAQTKITTRVADLPFEVVEGTEFTFTVHYDVAAQLGEVQLHVEMKGAGAEVLQSQIVRVTGEGSQTLHFTAPNRNEHDRLHFPLWYGKVWTDPIVPILFTDNVSVISQEQAALLRQQQAEAEKWRERMKDKLPTDGAVALLEDDLPGFDHNLAARVRQRLQAEGQPVVTLDTDQACNADILNATHFDTLVLTSSQVYPAMGGRALERFLASGGNLLALNAPGMRTTVAKIDGKWMSEADVREALAEQKPDRILLDFETGKADEWSHAAPEGSVAEWSFAPGGANGTGHALHCLVPKYESWNTLVAPALVQPFAAGQELTCFWAKGGPQTTHLALEWVEADGSRWIATVPLKETWRYYALTPRDFRYWHDNPSQGRGGPDDHLRSENATKLTVGLAMTHTPMASGRHEFWIDEIGVARNPLGELTTPGKMQIAPIEMVTPAYKFHRVTNAVSLKVSDKQCLLPAAELPVPEQPDENPVVEQLRDSPGARAQGLLSAHPRPQGTGYNKERKWRWVPLLEAFDESGEVCGTPACMVLNRTGRFADSVVTSFALPSAAYSDPKVLDLVAQAAKLMRQGHFLFEGGAEHYAYFQGEEVTLGARTINVGTGAEPTCTVRLVVSSEAGTEFERTVPVVDGRAECQWRPGRFSHTSYEVQCDLLDTAGNRVDTLTHPLNVWLPSENPKFMQVKDGGFYLRGKRWFAHGVNYMPSSGIGIEDGPYFEYWMGKQPYDPVVIERDLKRVKAMSMNMVSLFCYYRSLGSRNLLDILERCRRHGLMVNLSLRPGTPMDFRWKEMKALIEVYRLAENDTVFAYDLAWEPAFGNYNTRKRHDPQWEHWIIDRYGSLANAEEDWGMPVPRAEEDVTGPSDEQCTKEGDHRVMVCAYRRFLDDLLAKAYGNANRLVKSLDPNHLTSFRMAVAGDPTISPAWIGYDFRGLARSVDIMEPEGYGRIGDWDRVKPGRFTADYARCMAPGRPVMWAEFGRTTWDREAMDRDAELEEWNGRFYNDYFRMAYESDADGTVCWWYPGGFRVGENSDYGIINADGTWRPNSRAIQDWAAKMTAPRGRQPVDEWITIDRDSTVGGIVGVYNQVKERYWQLIEAGKNPGLRTDGFGLDSATAPRIAVGNVPYKPGRNPHKYLNAAFDRIEIRDAKGRWQTVGDGGGDPLTPGESVPVRVTVGNLGEATWLARPGNGQVGLRVGETFLPLPSDVPFTGTVTIEGEVPPPDGNALTFVMAAKPDVTFGEKAVARLDTP